jgi:hypothetical protein
MKLRTGLKIFDGLKLSVTKFAGRIFRRGASRPFAETYEDRTISIEPTSKYKLCRFSRCRFKWAESHVVKVFSGCTFEDCDLGMPLKEFLAHGIGSTVDQEAQSELLRRLALEEAVRRIRRRHPDLTVQCLDPCCSDERQVIAQWVSAEYRNIIAEAA